MKHLSLRLTKKAIALLLAVTTACLCLLSLPPVLAAEGVADNSADKGVLSDGSYFSYYLNYVGEERPNTSAEGVTASGKTELDGKQAVVLNKSNGTVQYSFAVEKSGIYNLKFCYKITDTENSDIQLSVMLDGKYPFDEAANLGLYRVYKDGEIKQDKYGNDIRPVSEEVSRWITAALSDSTGLYGEPYIFYLTAGVHTVSITTKNSVAIASAVFENQKAALSYKEYSEKHKDKAAGETLRQEAELIYEKNDTTIYPTYDHADAATLPSDPTVIRLNTVGQANWGKEGQFISWKADIKKAGLYSISFRANQSYNESGASGRRLLINGEVPFKEAQNIDFPYANNWYIKTVGEKEPCYFYLEPGDIITLECTAEETSEISRSVNNCLATLSRIYREIIVVTGTTPDAYRDYNLDIKIPALTGELKEVSDMLDQAIELIMKRTGKAGSAVSTLKQTKETIDNMLDRSYEIQNYISTMSGNIESMGSLVMSVGQQPLELDCIYFVAKGENEPKVSVSFFKKMSYGIKRFITSYANSYSFLNSDTKKLNVWVATGRDQLSILQRMIEDDFENNHNTKIGLSLVDTGQTLIQATLAGKGPDVALGIGGEYAINLAVRDALVDLKNYDLDSVYNNFHESAWTTMSFNGGVWSIPEVQSFDMLFYRTDIFEELGLKVPNTWEELYQILEVLQRNNLEVGITEVGANAGVSDGIATFAKFLLQNGGTYYTEDYKKTAFDTEEAYLAFRSWVELYSKYGLDRSFNFFNRFRTGVMPIAIQNYATYALIYSAAPEIRGLWAMAPIPGTLKADGSISRAESSGVGGCVMLKSAKKKNVDNEAFEFMKWWSSADIQLRYANELELSMGVAARYTPANLETLKKIGWADNEYSVIKGQLDEVVNFKEVPGNYVLARSLTSAFRNALTSTELPERQLEIYNKDINEEIARKAKEFKLY